MHLCGQILKLSLGRCQRGHLFSGLCLSCGSLLCHRPGPSVRLYLELLRHHLLHLAAQEGRFWTLSWRGLPGRRRRRWSQWRRKRRRMGRGPVGGPPAGRVVGTRRGRACPGPGPGAGSGPGLGGGGAGGGGHSGRGQLGLQAAVAGGVLHVVLTSLTVAVARDLVMGNWGGLHERDVLAAVRLPGLLGQAAGGSMGCLLNRPLVVLLLLSPLVPDVLGNS